MASSCQQVLGLRWHKGELATCFKFVCSKRLEICCYVCQVIDDTVRNHTNQTQTDDTCHWTAKRPVCPNEWLSITTSWFVFTVASSSATITSAHCATHRRALIVSCVIIRKLVRVIAAGNEPAIACISLPLPGWLRHLERHRFGIRLQIGSTLASVDTRRWLALCTRHHPNENILLLAIWRCL